jgi:Mpv17 / PMP22 family
MEGKTLNDAREKVCCTFRYHLDHICSLVCNCSDSSPLLFLMHYTHRIPDTPCHASDSFDDIVLLFVPQLKSEYVSTYLYDCMIWMPVQVINFRFVPAPLQAIYVNTFCVGWNGFLSYVHNRTVPGAVKPTSVASAEPLIKVDVSLSASAQKHLANATAETEAEKQTVANVKSK